MNIQSNSQQQQQMQIPRKQRRCWSPELHKRFLSALNELGGSQAATPKQIRELMKVDGLTNDEVKSHLQVGFEESFEESFAVPFSEKIIDGINQSPARRRALMLFCFVYMNTNARDAFMLSVDRKGFDVLGKVPGLVTKDGFSQFEWKEFRFTFKEAARDIEAFCQQLVEMEEEAIKNVSSYSGLG